MARCSSSRSNLTRFSSAQPRELEHPLGKNVALDLAGAAFDRIGPGAQQTVRPRRLVREALVTQDVESKLRQGLIYRRPLDLDNRTLRPRHAVDSAGESPISVEPDGLGLHNELRKPTPDAGVGVQPLRADELSQLRQRHPDLQ